MRSPSRCSSRSVRSPTPQSAPTGSGWRKSSTPSRGTTSRPSGLHRVEATLATNFVLATPTEQVTPWASTTCARIIAAIAAGAPSRRRAPATSRNASSSESGSTSGVTARKIAITPFDTSEYASNRGGSTVALGHSRRARAIGIAECTPNFRASYVAESTTPRPSPPMMTGVPIRSGVLAERDRRVERVHVDVQHRAAGVVGRRAGGRARAVELLSSAHCAVTVASGDTGITPTAVARAGGRRPPARDRRSAGPERGVHPRQRLLVRRAPAWSRRAPGTSRRRAADRRPHARRPRRGCRPPRRPAGWPRRQRTLPTRAVPARPVASMVHTLGGAPRRAVGRVRAARTAAAARSAARCAATYRSDALVASADSTRPLRARASWLDACCCRPGARVVIVVRPATAVPPRHAPPPAGMRRRSPRRGRVAPASIDLEPGGSARFIERMFDSLVLYPTPPTGQEATPLTTIGSGRGSGRGGRWRACRARRPPLASRGSATTSCCSTPGHRVNSAALRRTRVLHPARGVSRPVSQDRPAARARAGLVPVDPARRYVFPDGRVLDLPTGSRAALLDAFGRGLGTSAATEWDSLHRLGQRALGRGASPSRPTRRGHRSAEVDLGQWSASGIRRTDSCSIGTRSTPALDPARAPADLAILPYLEQAFGAWQVDGGLKTLTAAIAKRALRCGATLEAGTEAVADPRPRREGRRGPSRGRRRHRRGHRGRHRRAARIRAIGNIAPVAEGGRG